MKFRDIGANLTGKQFANDLAEVLVRAKNAGVDFIDITGTDMESSHAALALAKAHQGFLGASAGVHPHAAKTFTHKIQQELAVLLAQPEVLLCGEMGLDYARNYSTQREQLHAFSAQLELAHDIGKPLFLHCREAFSDFIAAMDRNPTLWPKSIVHCFTGTPDQALAIIERGGHIGVTGWVADKRRNADLLLALRHIPLTSLLLETDAPYLTPLNKPKSQARERNEPANMPWIAQAIAKAIGMPVDIVAKTATANADRIIGRGLSGMTADPTSSVRRPTPLKREG